MPHHACCRASASDRISRRKQTSHSQRQSVPFPHERQAVRPSAQRHPYRRLALSAQHTASSFDISLDENVKSFEISVWVYRDGEWFEDGKTHGNNDFLGKRIAIRLTENSYELYNISDNGHEKYSYPSLDTPFEESMGIGYSKIDREIPIELNKEIPICVKIGTSSNRMEVLDITEDFRKIECDAGIAVTITVSDEIVE